MNEPDRGNLHAELAERVGIDEESVRKVLSQLGLERVMDELSAQGHDKPVAVSDLKLAVRLGPNTVTV